MAMVSPAPGEDAGEIARLLLAIADKDVHHVQSTMDGPSGVAFIVPDWIAEEYVKQRFPAESQEEAPAPKRRGRPPKKQAQPEPSGVNGEEE